MTDTVLITCASSGIGRATAELLAERGWNVAATMRASESGAALARHDNVLVARLDVTEPASIESALVEVIAAFGRIDVVVNNGANPSKRAPTSASAPADRPMSAARPGSRRCSQCRRPVRWNPRHGHRDGFLTRWRTLPGVYCPVSLGEGS